MTVGKIHYIHVSKLQAHTFHGTTPVTTKGIFISDSIGKVHQSPQQDENEVCRYVPVICLLKKKERRRSRNDMT